MLPTPLCPLLLQARATIPLIRARVDVELIGNGNDDAASVTDGPLFPIPSVAPGVACLGSRCAWWESQPEVRPDAEGALQAAPPTHGRCAQAPAADFRPDPAAGGAS